MSLSASVLDRQKPQLPPRSAFEGPARLARSLITAPVCVLKFGSSILRRPDDVPDAVSEIYRRVRRGSKVVAVVSAFSGQTDRLLGEARRLGGRADRHLPAYVALGEEASAALVAVGCDRVGLDAVSLSVRELGVVAHGSPEDAWPSHIGSDALMRALADHDVVVAPGFGAVTERGHTVLLGRGGTDLTAVLLAAYLGSPSALLIKDVDGVYEGDPARGEAVKRFDRLSWERARAVAGKLVQRRAIDAGEALGVEIEVGALGCDRASVIGEADTAPMPAPERRRLRVAVAGCGVVGGGVLARLLHRPQDFEVTAILVRDPFKKRDIAVDPALFTADHGAFLDSTPDIVVEALSEGDAGRRLVEASLARGVDVVSADKQALAEHLDRLQALAMANGAQLAYSAAVGGGTPMIETMRRARAKGRVSSFEAVLNGTVNFILTRLGMGESFDDALAEAKRAGFAEEDASADLEGLDAGAKLQILAHEAFSQSLDAIRMPRAALSPDTASDARDWARLKQISRCEAGEAGLSAQVAFEPRSDDPAFVELADEANALRITLEDGTVIGCRGRGAGRWPTTEAVMADLVDLSQARI